MTEREEKISRDLLFLLAFIFWVFILHGNRRVPFSIA